MSAATKIKLGILTIVLLLLGGKLFGETILRRHGGERGTVNLPACSMKLMAVSVPTPDETWGDGYEMADIETDCRFNLPGAMGPSLAISTMAGSMIHADPISGEFTISGAVLMALRDGGVTAFDIRFVDFLGTWIIHARIKLTPGSNSYEVLVK